MASESKIDVVLQAERLPREPWAGSQQEPSHGHVHGNILIIVLHQSMGISGECNKSVTSSKTRSNKSSKIHWYQLCNQPFSSADLLAFTRVHPHANRFPSPHHNCKEQFLPAYLQIHMLEPASKTKMFQQTPTREYVTDVKWYCGLR